MQSTMSRRESEVGARPPIRRMAIVALASLAIVGAAALYPLVSPIRDALPPASLMAQAAGLLSGLAWLATLLVAMTRQPEGRLWKLILALIVTERLPYLESCPTRSCGASRSCSKTSGSRSSSTSSWPIPPASSATGSIVPSCCSATP